jgi:hypothetical protein
MMDTLENWEDEWGNAAAEAEESWDSWFWGDFEEKDWEAEWDMAMAELEDKFDQFDADFDWHNATNWNESDW